MAGAALRVEPLGGSLGAEARGVDLKQALDAATVAELRRLVGVHPETGRRGLLYSAHPV
jgi:alpha-ketoglutarate-dependent taurine dioxygenase